MVELKVLIEELSPQHAIAVTPALAKQWRQDIIANPVLKLVMRNPKNLARHSIALDFFGLSDIPEQMIVINKTTAKLLAVEQNGTININWEMISAIDSFNFIKRKMKGGELTKDEIDQIVLDIITGKLSELEQASFVLNQEYRKWSPRETELLTRAFVDHSDTLNLPGAAYDKHSLGGVPGNKVSLLIVPIVAAAGLMIPKTSSRAITSPSGTADTMEALGCNIVFSMDEIKEILSKSGGLIAWAGGLNLVPADNILIENVERPLGIDPATLIQVSIMSKKLAMGIDGMVLDVPMGKGTKVPTMDVAIDFSNDIKILAQRINIKLEAAITFGSQPIGVSIGPCLEAREGLRALMEPAQASSSLREKSTELAGTLLELAGVTNRGHGTEMAKQILMSGKAYERMKMIIEAQGGNKNIKPDDIELGQYVFEYMSPQDGYVVDIDNSRMNSIAKAAGCPSDPRAGILMLKKRDYVKCGETILRIYSSSEANLSAAITQLSRANPLTFGGMILQRI